MSRSPSVAVAIEETVLAFLRTKGAAATQGIPLTEVVDHVVSRLGHVPDITIHAKQVLTMLGLEAQKLVFTHGSVKKVILKETAEQLPTIGLIEAHLVRLKNGVKGQGQLAPDPKDQHLIDKDLRLLREFKAMMQRRSREIQRT